MSATAHAELNDVVNGMTNIAFSDAPHPVAYTGYKGYVEANYTQGIGHLSSNFVTAATSQGAMITDNIYIGGGIGIDMMWTTIDAGWGEYFKETDKKWDWKNSVKTAIMIPVFSDFRFVTRHSSTQSSLFLNLRVGCTFLCNDRFVRIGDGLLTSKEFFYLQPSIGVRVPINRTKPRQAFDLGVHYRLMTSRYATNWQREAAINGLGINISYEW
ncbi:MAG: hypothetical protein K2M87_02710 [Muribaculaceae bacterium]|nr:hypothetical protein [Muribaculaceae bacterium]